MVIIWPMMHPSSFILSGLFKHSNGLDDFTFLTILFLIANQTPEEQSLFSRTEQMYFFFSPKIKKLGFTMSISYLFRSFITMDVFLSNDF